MIGRLPAKAENSATRSDAIVVSFGSYWHSRLRAKSFSAVIRKRVPSSSRPNWLYFHVNSPISAICGRATVQDIDHLSIASALKMSAALNLSAEEIRSYLAHEETVGAYRLGEIELAKIEVPAKKLRERLEYNPPQSFFVLSKEAKELIDTMCCFEATSSKPKRVSIS